MNVQDKKIAVIGLGYVGLPLAIEFGKKYRVLGFDIKAARIEELQAGEDSTLEADLEGMKIATDLYKKNEQIGLSFSSIQEDLKNFNTFIVTVPTPIDEFNNPDNNESILNKLFLIFSLYSYPHKILDTLSHVAGFE